MGNVIMNGKLVDIWKKVAKLISSYDSTFRLEELRKTVEILS